MQNELKSPPPLRSRSAARRPTRVAKTVPQTRVKRIARRTRMIWTRWRTAPTFRHFPRPRQRPSNPRKTHLASEKSPVMASTARPESCQRPYLPQKAASVITVDLADPMSSMNSSAPRCLPLLWPSLVSVVPSLLAVAFCFFRCFLCSLGLHLEWVQFGIHRVSF